MARKKNKVVPVANRTTTDRKRKVAVPRVRMDLREIVILVMLIVMVILLIRIPLSNYLEQRAEIARLNSSIAAKEAQKAQLQEELNKYQSDAYVREQARVRLGVIGEGETAYRIIDPAAQAKDNDAAQDTNTQESAMPWYKILWNSVSVPPQEEEPGVKPSDELHLPIMPE